MNSWFNTNRIGIVYCFARVLQAPLRLVGGIWLSLKECGHAKYLFPYFTFYLTPKGKKFAFISRYSCFY